MYTSRSQTTVPASPAEVLALLTEPEAIARWAPIPFEVVPARWRRLKTGSHAHVAGRLAGRSVEFDVDVLHVSDQWLELVADGAISLGVHYVMRPASAGSRSGSAHLGKGRRPARASAGKGDRGPACRRRAPHVAR